MAGSCQFLTRADLGVINRAHCEDTGGLHDGGENLANPDSLEYILEAIQGSLFGVERYPSIVEKAAALGFHIITRHVFRDGNKRTGLDACAIFLELNGFEMALAPHDEVLRKTLDVAASQVTLEDFTQWLRQRTRYAP